MFLKPGFFAHKFSLPLPLPSPPHPTTASQQNHDFAPLWHFQQRFISNAKAIFIIGKKIKLYFRPNNCCSLNNWNC